MPAGCSSKGVPSKNLALNAPSDRRDAGSTEDSAARAAESMPMRDAGSTEAEAAGAAESKQAAMGKQIKALQRQLAAVRASDGAAGDPGVITISSSSSSSRSSSELAATPAALDAFEVEEIIAGAFDILRRRIPYQPFS